MMESDYIGPVNLGNPNEMTILGLAEAVLELSRSNSRIEHIEPVEIRVTDDPKLRRPDISNARKHLGWEPVVNLADGLAETITFFRSRLS